MNVLQRAIEKVDQSDLVDFDLRETMEDVVETLAESAYAKELELVSWVAADVNTALNGDERQVRNILLNVVMSAVKLTEKGDVLVRAIRDSETESSIKVRFEVRANGKRRSLGSAAVKKAVGLMGGEMSFDGVCNESSSLWFAIRFQKQDFKPSFFPPPISQLGETCCLVVDDTEINRKILHDHLAKWGILSDGAENAPLALHMLQQALEHKEPYHLAVIDMEMPGCDGLTFTRQIRSDPRLEGLRLALLSPLHRRPPRPVLDALGIDRCLTKPIRQLELHKTVSEILNKDCLFK